MKQDTPVTDCPVSFSQVRHQDILDSSAQKDRAALSQSKGLQNRRLPKSVANKVPEDYDKIRRSNTYSSSTKRAVKPDKAMENSDSVDGISEEISEEERKQRVRLMAYVCVHVHVHVHVEAIVRLSLYQSLTTKSSSLQKWMYIHVEPIWSSRCDAIYRCQIFSMILIFSPSRTLPNLEYNRTTPWVLLAASSSATLQDEARLAEREKTLLVLQRQKRSRWMFLTLPFPLDLAANPPNLLHPRAPRDFCVHSEEIAPRVKREKVKTQPLKQRALLACRYTPQWTKYPNVW